ncbi:MAG: hypothetical protein LYZ66_01760 [Nitrososphaerales archaeon]|nr:hypothetical protein [Nitrososphaerales archaeon]
MKPFRYCAAITRQGYEDKEKVIMSGFLQLKENYEELKGEIQSLRSERSSRRASA